MRIHSFAHADVEEASKAHLFAAWSNLVTGESPTGLIDCYLLEGDGVVQVAAVWENVEAHDQALADEGNHPAFVVFEAAGIDVTHSLMTVVGFLGR
jgi:hypothetical protein